MAVGFMPLHANRKNARARAALAHADKGGLVQRPCGRRADARTKAIISGPDHEGQARNSIL